MKLRIALFAMLLSPMALASTIAIVDSGTDYRHSDLSAHYIVSRTPTPGYADDMYGWNFAENNNKVIDYAYLGTFSQDVYKFFEVQTRKLEGTATQDDLDWYDAAKTNEELMKQLGVFGNFAHGTHVAGISMGVSTRSLDGNRMFAAKIIPTEVKLPFSAILAKSAIFSSPVPMAMDLKESLLKMALGQLAKQQATLMGTVGKYVSERKADVANGSFGTGYAQAKMIVEALYNLAYKEAQRDPAQLDRLVKGFLTSMMNETKVLVTSSPNTLWVFAAGNDSSDNDVMPTSPTNIKMDNTISVAATLHNQSLAEFSNFGAKMVEVAAPGVGIISTYPGNEHGPMSGTSQAAPYVTAVAGEVKTRNPALTPAEIKMIIMATVDRKPWLAGKVSTSGVVNPERAFAAAQNSTTMDIYVAIAEARKMVVDMFAPIEMSTFKNRTPFRAPAIGKDAAVLPLPSPLY